MRGGRVAEKYGSDMRARLVARAVSGWVDQLTDLSARNNLLYYRDLRRGTLDLGNANTGPRERLLGGRPVRCSQLFPDPVQRDDAVARLKEIHRKIRELDEERGINAGYVVAGMASWREDRKSPAAPVLLRALSLTPTSASRDDFELVLDEESAVNPVLLFKFRSDFRLDIPEGLLEDLVGESPFDAGPVYERLRKLAGGIPGFAVASRLVAGTFTYAKFPMVRDLQESSDMLVASDVVAALAGDQQAEEAIRAQRDGSAGAADGIRPPKREFLVLDADTSQSAAVNAALAGKNLVIQGPPGTGKSQTIANMIASLVAERKSVLFVAEKRAAIDAVLRRLDGRNLSGLVLDIHDGVKNKRKIAQDLDAALHAISQIPVPDVSELHRGLANRVQRIDDHAAVMNEVRQPWGVSLFNVQARLMRIPEQQRSTVRVRGDMLQALSGEAAERARDDLWEYAGLQGQIHPPWAGAAIRSREEAELASDMARNLNARLPEELGRLSDICRELGVPQRATVAAWADLYALLEGVSDTSRLLGADLFGTDIAALTTATARRRERRARGGPALGWSARRALRKQAQALWRDGKPVRRRLHEMLAAAEAQAAAWQQAGYPGQPRVPGGWATVTDEFAELRKCVHGLDGVLAGSPLGKATCSDLQAIADRLAADGQSPRHLARLAELADRLGVAGLGALAAEIARRNASPEQAAAAFDSVWYASILDHIRMTDRRCDALSGSDLNRVVAEFQEYDTEHLAKNADRIRRIAAQQARDAQDAYQDQASLVRREAGKARKHMPLRDLLDRAPDVMLALKPCWATSPIVVSQVLPPSRLFDVVIFDEASQVKQADAIPPIMRASQVIVAGDKKQLPPTDFFSSAADEEDEENIDDLVIETGGIAVPRTGGAFDSILDTLGTVLADAPLTWHYRSRDERLITFSNQHFYEPKMTTFPGIGKDRCLEHVVTEQPTGVAGQEQSVSAEVNRVVELILEHAKAWPSESLGVITLGITHARRIQAELEAALRLRNDLEDFFRETGTDEPFFVKNLERVQGDERDAIILSVGYGKTADGRMQYRWGPLLNSGGERRLNVAVTRARKRLTLVTSFRTEETDPARVQKEGGKLLCAYLRYVDSGGGDPGVLRGGSGTQLNPFELDVMERLQAAGIPVIPQYGVGGMRIDFAAQHPQLPGRMVLAIEADGASYHSAGNARDRDRLRQQHLERLGWRFHRVWSTDWFEDPDLEVARIRAAYDQAVWSSRIDGQSAGQATATPPSQPQPENERAAAQPAHRTPQPWFQPGLAIDQYSQHELGRIARWIESDGTLRTEEQVLAEIMAVLGFQRRGSKIEPALRAAIRAARRRPQ
jgi:very-short-patch-repair endonuclease